MDTGACLHFVLENAVPEEIILGDNVKEEISPGGEEHPNIFLAHYIN